MVTTNYSEKILQLNDLEICLLLGLVAREHCIIKAGSNDECNHIGGAITRLSHSIFGLSSVLVQCHASTTVEDLTTAILVAQSYDELKANEGITSKVSDDCACS